MSQAPDRIRYRRRGDIRDWRDDALCRSAGIDMYPTEEWAQVAAARVCADCPVIDACREHAIRYREEDGVWGGLTEIERRRIFRRQRVVPSPQPSLF